MALGFAGLTVVVAVVAATSLDMFLPSGAAPEPEQQVEEAAPAARSAPATPEPTWADEPLADDWNSDSVRQANGFGGWAAGSGGSNDEVDEIDFGDYSPSNGGGSSGVARDPTKPRKVAGQGIVTSRAARNAPAVAAPGTAPAGELTRAD